MLLFLFRFIIYPIPESPKFLISNGRDEECLRVLHFIAKENGRECRLTLKDLKEAGLGMDSIHSQIEKDENVNGVGKEITVVEDEEKKDHDNSNGNVNSKGLDNTITTRLTPVQVVDFNSSASYSQVVSSNLLSRDTW